MSKSIFNKVTAQKDSYFWLRTLQSYRSIKGKVFSNLYNRYVAKLTFLLVLKVGLSPSQKDKFIASLKALSK